MAIFHFQSRSESYIRIKYCIAFCSNYFELELTVILIESNQFFAIFFCHLKAQQHVMANVDSRGEKMNAKASEKVIRKIKVN